MKKLAWTLTLFSLFAAGPLSAEDYSYIGGNGYRQYRRAPNLAPGIALGIIALAAIIAVAVQNLDEEHGHAIVD